MVLLRSPLQESFESDEFTLVEQDKPEYYLQEKTLCSSLNIPESEKKLLPRGWQILGEIIIVTLNEKLEHRKFEIGEALL